MGKKGSKGSGNILTWLVLAGGAFLAFEYFTNKGGQYDYLSKILDTAGISSKYVRGNVLWGPDTDYYY